MEKITSGEQNDLGPSPNQQDFTPGPINNIRTALTQSKASRESKQRAFCGRKGSCHAGRLKAKP